MTLREAVEANHRAAEQTPLARSMIDGTMTIEQYHNFIFNMKEVYSAIEKRITFMPLDVQRTQKYVDDLASLGRGAGTTVLSTNDYVRYLSQLDIPKVWAHVYVHYLGNMYGGQMLKKNMPWQSSHLDFDDVKGSIAYVRANITGIDHGEANLAFEWTVKIYDELHRAFGRDSTSA